MENKPSAVLVGQESLLALCGDELLIRGWSIAGVVTQAPGIARWASGLDIDVYAQVPLEKPAPDVLFVIAQLSPLEAEVLSWSRWGAIGLHDGLHALGDGAAGAVYRGARGHGVSWRTMALTGEPQSVLAERTFELPADADQFEANARCFEAAYGTFVAMLPALEELPARETLSIRTVTATAVTGDDDFAPKHGFVDVRSDAATNRRLLLATANRGRRNRFGLAKLYLGLDEPPVCIEGAIEPPQADAASPGTVLGHSWGRSPVRIALPDGTLRIDAFRSLRGVPLDVPSALVPGESLPPMPDVFDTSAAAHRAALVQADVLRGLATAPVFEGVAWIDRWSTHRLDRTCDPETALLALLGLQYKLHGAQASYVPYADAAAIGAAAASAGYLHAFTPVHTEFASASVGALTQLVKQQLSARTAPATLPRDLSARLPQQAAALERWFAADWGYVDAPVELLSGELRDGPGLVFARDAESGQLSVVGRVSRADAARLGGWWCDCIDELAQGASELGTTLFGPADEAAYDRLHAHTLLPPPDSTLVDMWQQARARHGDQLALQDGTSDMTFAQLDAASLCIARHLVATRTRGRIGVHLRKDCQCVAVLLGILRAGCAYVPLDPTYPSERIDFIARDAQLSAVFTGDATRSLLPAGLPCPVFDPQVLLESDPDTATATALPAPALDDCAYAIYTSGSTGQPKGVLISHLNLANFVNAMDERLGVPQGKMLCVTSISFDISVLEIWWSLSRGMPVYLHDDQELLRGDTATPAAPLDLEFSLYYWNTESVSAQTTDPYELLFAGAEFAEANGFNALWTPERHFGDFGGYYPNPAVTSAALAARTSRVQLRAGSCVMPLHDPIRVAEEWAVVDNLSNGRVGVSFASGWMPNDFVLKPENFADAKGAMYRGIETVHALWRGEAIERDGPLGPVHVKSLPRPVQPELPTWITTAGNRESFEQAGRAGFNLLTHLLGQELEALKDNIAAYRAAWLEAGHSGRGTVSLMLHTLVGDDDATVMEVARDAMKRYLRSALSLVKAAAWEFPTYKSFSEDGKRSVDEYFETLTDADLDDLLEFAYQRYFTRSGLFGSQATCLEFLGRVAAADVDEVCALIDYGLANDVVLAGLPNLAQLKERARGAARSVGRIIAEEGITHLQCTPSQARMMLFDADERASIAGLDTFLVGGEACSQRLADELGELVSGRVFNMYGPTETTVWSTVDRIEAGQPIRIGQPIANTRIRVVDAQDAPVPVGVAGELLIGGCGVAIGYHERDELNAQRFVRFDDEPGTRYYRTGDQVRLTADDTLEYLGRGDGQVKVRGHRVELGEIENRISAIPGVRHAAVTAEPDASDTVALVGYYTAQVALAPTDVAHALRAQLPAYMVPSRLRALVQMPFTPNGKIDRQRLADAAALDDPAVTDTAPSDDEVSEFGEEMAAIWCELLDVPSVDVNSNFFDIGGHSILVVRLQGVIAERFGTKLPIAEFFRYPTVSSLAKRLEGGSGVDATQTPARSKNTRRAARRRRVRGR